MLHTKIVNSKDSKLLITEAENFISYSDFGASIIFTGTVRNQNNNQTVIGITYDSHDEPIYFLVKSIVYAVKSFVPV